ncbi:MULTISPECIES: LysR family transcriptional regulator [unclassified Polaromonas]|jgi:DNA-binding transcriptional LysR family regulator|uniref:LysR family transcriptional regulator n=1 Tax=unclassified Polaromonas TaxID=2638319 RepID=UPI000BD42C79|nr:MULTISPECIES: LysR family transcriptional regulator [unclassified Polaromonas]OYY34174.1 MAG: LysR family transcriptional regulator [Polaromonas sp. 35-63-35]OYZ20950.1 MAG: LysR family transcriptional regulator [Polaromonas sp. 16-63-31]OYZ78389.1 MAG: LysR family transcriptional regulator [Polaromonas sp. 24-63-21]OZA49227.1 MAG: LysR family transcriptional regulator [Polaromonas sp. 17-63-33]OZA85930.1 MAG: LysR family transcriptional regulator [Polaromonas sp. 39-63-25]
MNNNFDWRLVRSFLAALDQGSLLGAARVLSASQPTIGRHIAELEAQLGVLLFERTGRGLLPTATALQLAESARAMDNAANELARNVSGLEPGISGTVRITASQPVACFVLPPILAQMRLALPDIQVELVASNAVSNLLRREADIALRMVQPDQASLVVKRIARVTLGTYAHRDYLRRRGTPKQPQDLLNHELVGSDRDEAILKGMAGFGLPVTREAFAFRCDDLIAYWEAVRAGLGIGFIADYLAATDRDVVAVLPMIKVPPLPIWLTVHREIRTSRRIRAVYDFLSQAVPKAL